MNNVNNNEFVYSMFLHPGNTNRECEAVPTVNSIRMEDRIRR